jgi:hypothetical protein
MTPALRAILVSLALIVLLVSSFVVGRATASSSHSAPRPASFSVPSAVVQSATYPCRVGKPC